MSRFSVPSMSTRGYLFIFRCLLMGLIVVFYNNTLLSVNSFNLQPMSHWLNLSPKYLHLENMVFPWYTLVWLHADIFGIFSLWKCVSLATSVLLGLVCQFLEADAGPLWHVISVINKCCNNNKYWQACNIQDIKLLLASFLKECLNI